MVNTPTNKIKTKLNGFHWNKIIALLQATVGVWNHALYFTMANII